MITIDGEAGGGQMLRTALTLSLITDRPFEITEIRGNRPTPGLKPQHLTAVELAADLCDAELSGASQGSESLTFRPGSDWKTTLSADVGTAGSLTLLFDTVLPVASALDEQLSVTATGGTDVKWSPTVGHYRHVKLPLLARHGLQASVTLDRTGFYPAGGGKATLTAEPSTLSPLALDRRGGLDAISVYSKASADLEDSEVAARQAGRAAELLTDAGLPVADAHVAYVETDSTGSALVAAGEYERTILGVDALGEPGLPSEEVAAGAVERFVDLHRAGAVVDPHMADQTMVYLALAGGTVAIPRVTDHVETNLAVIEAFEQPLSLSERGGTHLLEATPEETR
jgi:RNA 3'-terminal phosphate cyclase (ATP)